MSLLDALRRLTETTPYQGQSSMGANACGFCGEEIGMFWQEDGPRHSRDCPWLSMPQIVAVLEAAERVAAEEPRAERRCVECVYCLGCLEERCSDPRGHKDDCPWQALVAALEGEVAQSDDEKQPLDVGHFLTPY